MKKIWYLDIIVFLSAFLLFQIELSISKILLPKFGGSYSVWGAALVFFQWTLLLGYAYSHFVVQKYGISRYKYFHLGLLLLTLFFFPGRALPAIYSQYQIPMVINVFWQLLRSIGLVFFVLSTTSIIFQSWLAESELDERSNPYALYAVSNLGSFAGLITYPFFFEVFFNLDTQLDIWRVIYFIWLVFQIIAFKLIGLRSQETKTEQALNSVSFQEKLRWFLLGAAGIVMFLSVTNIITYEIAPIPLLWIIPLCIYLISFVLNFKKNPWCPPWIEEKFYVTISFSLFFLFFTYQKVIPFTVELICHLALLFILCMFCQNQLNKYKPADSRQLTTFYLIISIGGFVGGILTSWIIPLVSTSMIEYLVGLFIICLSLVTDKKKIWVDSDSLRLLIYTVVLILIWPVVFWKYNIFGIIIIVLLLKSIYSEFSSRPFVLCLSLLAILILSDPLTIIWSKQIFTYRHRNYYGIYKVYEKYNKRFLVHGTTIHGSQYIIKEKEKVPLTYYHYSTPVGQVASSELFDFERIGIIGLGTGTLAVYGKKDRAIDFFELDPDILYIAKKYFTYLGNSPSKINYILGDARLSLRKTPNKHYDLLIIDAFSGDAIPTHLLTKEAITEYLRCISDDGIILFHISNRYLDLRPVLFSNANALNLNACFNFNPFSKENRDAFSSSWLAITPDANVFEKFTSQLKWRKSDSVEIVKKFRPWTDKYSNILPILNFENLLSQIKEFQPFYWDFNLMDTD